MFFLKTIQLTLDGREGVFPIGTTYEQAIGALWPERPLMPLAVAVDGQVRPLDEAPKAEGSSCILDYTKDEGRRVYERSIRLLFSVAVKALFPEASVRIEHSVHHGIYASLDKPLSDQDVQRLEAYMRKCVEEGLPFTRLRWKTDQVLEYFKVQGEMDKYRLLAGRGERYHTIYACGELYEHFFGKLTPSARYLRVFSLASYPPGLVVRLPAASEPDRPAKGDERPKLMRTFEQSARWSRILHCSSIADLNEMIRDHHIRDFIRVNEALHEKSIADIADQIVRRGARVVLVAGPSSSGKTTFTNRLAIHLRVNGKRPVMLSLDEYYRDRDETPLDEEGNLDLEALDALDVPLLNRQLNQLIAGEAVTVPHFDFQTGKSRPGRTLQLQSDQPLLVEGIHGLNPRLSQTLPADAPFRVYISALTTLNLDAHNRTRTTDVRLMRRIVRDHQFRNSPIERTLSMWPSVRRGEELYIFPYQEMADVMFNSTLHYELAILKRHVAPLLRGVAEDSPYAPTAQRLENFLHYVDEADVEDEIGPLSILREFIGGCTFYR